MIAIESKLQLVSSDIFHSEISFNASRLSHGEVIEKMNKVPVDIDFDVKRSSKGDLFVFASVRINSHEDADFGYSIHVSGATLFTFAEGMSENEREDFIGSAVSISITNLRNYINNTTSYYPLGSFSFHSIDMKALFDAKANKKSEYDIEDDE